jgi:hypothetical protein
MQQQNCFLCGKEISWLRSTVDRQYCSDEHRKEARLAATSVLQEEEEETDLWSVSKSKQKKAARAAQSQATPAYLLFALGAVILVMAFMPNNSGASRPSSGSAISLSPAKDKAGLVARANGFFAAVIRERAPVTLQHDFSKGLRDWTSGTIASATGVDDPHDWKRPSSPSFVAPGSIRLWARSIPMRNYQMDFQGQIQKRSLSWAFRASDAKNYYAAKIVITKPGPLPNAGLVHYVVLNGHERDRVQLPLPITLERGEDYRVRVAVQDNRFITYLNGQVISSWRDDTLTRGGVGFFSDRDDEQKVSWVSLSERDSFLGQMLSHFTLFVMPQLPAAP